MIALFHTGSELRRFKRQRMTRVAVAAICIMPILYSTLYLWSYWNPFNNVNNLPVALVNADRGAMVDGQRLDAGQKISDALIKDGSLKWEEVSHQEAVAGVRDGTYYFSVELPPNFSEAVASPTSGDPRQATLEATYNDANGYLSTLIGENAMREVLNAVDTRISSEAVDKLLVGLVNAGMGLNRAADGAQQLNAGLGKLEDGTQKLQDGLQRNKAGTSKLADGTAELNANIPKLQDGSGQLKDGIDQLADGTQQLADGVNSQAGGLTALQDGAQRLQDGTARLGQGAQQIDDGVEQIESKVDAASAIQADSTQEIREIAAVLRTLPDPASQVSAHKLEVLADQLDAVGVGPQSPLVNDVHRLSAGTDELARQLNSPDAEFRGGIDRLAGGVGKLEELVDGINRLNEGAHKLQDGAGRLDAGIGRLGEGVTKLDDGAHKLDAGATKLLDGATKLNDGATKAHAGSEELASKLSEGANQAPKWSADQRRQIASVMGGPVDVSASNNAGNNSFGSGLAPFFFTLALYIGGIITFLLLNPLHHRAISSGVRPIRVAIDGLTAPAAIGILQALVILGTTMLATPLWPATVLGLVGMCILTSLMFMAINQMFNVLLGPGPGKVASMAFLMIQVVSSGGLYPVETQPMALQVLHPIMPMTYAVEGIRQVLYGDFDPRIGVAVAACIVITIGAVLMSSLAARRDRVWTMRRLHPPVPV
ncbi:YhgE/Pip domain-containing protein [Corynebacterium sp. TAE3-ERU12]|uniref:YhgE/Pip domain-containing protein n=1 Tax=Corynebacterium sp. TAE3-ERU12 TaxID=2849491 RepID=UPI001C436E2E|nr:YhgE/Pip domain-containing protein [Corynebacterium sp. TAE3-ERU12]MBV7296027.1 YhgE/Pip domain-containing protein [Corynebacterium sp. TAE3-ERU12]